MITADEIQQPRTPKELREFVEKKRAEIEADDVERHRAILKEELYKEFVDEIMPLARCAQAIYSEEFRIRPVLGSQGYDAQVLDDDGKEVDRIEVSAPKFGAENAIDARLVVSQGVSRAAVWDDDDSPLAALAPLVIAAANAKAAKDYSDCTLLIVAATTYPPHESEIPKVRATTARLLRELRKIRFRAKRVLIDITPLRRVYRSR